MKNEKMKKLICPKRTKECRERKCKGAYRHYCAKGNETHGCLLYISQPFCKESTL